MIALEMETADAESRIFPDAPQPASGFVFECVCGREIKTPVRIGECECGRLYDITAWGK